ncbi:MAG: phosphate transport system permease protein, partial [Thermodesulfobacteriota bacterium]|nr:phosphate transport system permease protein [Thermodesulfobacteriota bacterium]
MVSKAEKMTATQACDASNEPLQPGQRYLQQNGSVVIQTDKPVTESVEGHSEAVDLQTPRATKANGMSWDLKARGEPFMWTLGGALVIGLLMIVGFTVLIIYNGILTFWPQPLYRVTLKDGAFVGGELFLVEN